MTGNTVKLNHKTLHSQVNGRVSIQQANKLKSWLKLEKMDIIIKNTLELAARGFLLSPQRLCKHANEILKARLEDKFPEGGVGVQWPYCFIKKNDNHLHICWSHSLHTNHGWAINPTTNEDYFDLLGSTMTKFDIGQENTWATDEMGIQLESGQKEQVIGKAGKKSQYQQQSRSRENITVIVTICADSSSIAPAVIFKGQDYSTFWKQNNPLNIS